jgi:integrase
LYYQFHLHLGLLATSGIRPPSKRKNVIRDEHISFVRGGIFLARMNMKGHDYTSLCLPDFKNYYDKAIDLKKRFKVKSEFLLPHLLDRGMCKKGEPILSWRKQWTSALQELQIPKMTLYALRHFYITGRVEDTNASPLEIAKITGTSVRMIEATYFAPNIEDNYSKLTQTSQKFDIEDL